MTSTYSAEQLKQIALEEIEILTAPSDSTETKIASKLLKMEAQKVFRPPNFELFESGMLQRDAFRNCVKFQSELNQPSEIKLGWWTKGTNFILHAIVSVDGTLICVTPNQVEEEWIYFITDNRLKLGESLDGGLYPLFKNKFAPSLVRGDPKTTIKEFNEAKKLILSGVEPMEAIKKTCGFVH